MVAPMAQPRSIPFGAPHTINRLGWGRETSMIIFHGCYELHHVVSQCTANITDLHRIVSNFESFTADEMARVPEKYYLITRGPTTVTPENDLLREVKMAETKPKE